MVFPPRDPTPGGMPGSSPYGRSSGGLGVALLDRGADRGAAAGRIDARGPLDGGGGAGQRRVLDRVAEPARVVASSQVVHPRLVVDAVRHLEEEREVLGAQVQPLAGPAEVEAAVRTELALRVLAHVALPLGPRRRAAKPDRKSTRLNSSHMSISYAV